MILSPSHPKINSISVTINVEAIISAIPNNGMGGVRKDKIKTTTNDETNVITISDIAILILVVSVILNNNTIII
jgi:hypothetical protein